MRSVVSIVLPLLIACAEGGGGDGTGAGEAADAGAVGPDTAPRDDAHPGRVDCVATAEIADATYTDRRVTEYGAQGEPLRESHDFDTDGSTDAEYVWTYGADGHVDLVTYASGDVLITFDSTWDGDLLVEYTVEDLEGFYDIVRTWTYDADGHPLTKTVINAAVAGLDHHVAFEHRDGRRVGESIDHGIDGTIDQTIEVIYGEGTVEERSEGADPAHVWTKTSTLDDLGNVVRLDEDEGSDGAPDRLFTWGFDALNREVVHTVQRYDDPSDRYEATTAWDCP